MNIWDACLFLNFKAYLVFYLINAKSFQCPTGFSSWNPHCGLPAPGPQTLLNIHEHLGCLFISSLLMHNRSLVFYLINAKSLPLDPTKVRRPAPEPHPLGTIAPPPPEAKPQIRHCLGTVLNNFSSLPVKVYSHKFMCSGIQKMSCSKVQIFALDEVLRGLALRRWNQYSHNVKNSHNDY